MAGDVQTDLTMEASFCLNIFYSFDQKNIFCALYILIDKTLFTGLYTNAADTFSKSMKNEEDSDRKNPQKNNPLLLFLRPMGLADRGRERSVEAWPPH